MNDRIGNINISDYAEKKAKGLIALAKVGKAVAACISNFSSDTGEELEPYIVAIHKSQLEGQKAELQKAIDSVDGLLKDVDELLAAG